MLGEAASGGAGVSAEPELGMEGAVRSERQGEGSPAERGSGKPATAASRPSPSRSSHRHRRKERRRHAARSRSLVEQLSKVDPTCMNCDERLAFWINLYNALIMHAYLAYGVPDNDIKLFSLMQKACYMVGGQSFSAAEIEFVILQMKTPVHRPQLPFINSELSRSTRNTQSMTPSPWCCLHLVVECSLLLLSKELRKQLQIGHKTIWIIEDYKENAMEMEELMY